MSEQFLLSGASYRNFIETIHSPFSRVNYKNSLSLYMQFRKVDNGDSLVTEDPKLIQDSLINYIIYLRGNENCIFNYIHKNCHIT